MDVDFLVGILTADVLAQDDSFPYLSKPQAHILDKTPHLLQQPQPSTFPLWERSKAARTRRRLQATQGSDSHTVQSSQARPLTDCMYIQKAEAANQKRAAEDGKKAIAEDQEWSKGAKSNARKCVPSPAPKLH